MNARTITRAAALTAGSGMLIATFLSQHPNAAFNRIRRLDPFGVFVPNWRFFAPEPATHDFHLLHRTLDVDDVTSPWEDTTAIAPRRPIQMVWFPGRRAEKATFDVISEFLQSIHLGYDQLTEYPAYQALSAKARAAIIKTAPECGARVQGYQFLVARSAGIAPDAEPEYLFMSAFIPLEHTDDR
jgi:hypothetical protein